MEPRIHGIEVLEVILKIYGLSGSGVQTADKLIEEFDLLVLIGIGFHKNLLYGCGLPFGDVQGGGQGHGILGFCQIIVELNIVVELLYAVEIGLHHHLGDVFGRQYLVEYITPNTPNKNRCGKKDEVLLDKEQEQDDDVEDALEDASNEFKEPLEGPAYHLK